MNNPAKFDVAVLIGRFQPFHNGHATLLAKALETADKVLVLLGSAHAARNAKNPFIWEERAAMIGATLDVAAQARVSYLPIRDYYDDQRWCDAVTAAVKAEVPQGKRVALVGYLKDASSHYLQRFSGWEFIAASQFGEIDATSLRQIYFDGEDWGATQALLGGLMPPSILHYLKGWSHLPYYLQMKDEHQSIEENKRIWGIGPFITVDAIVTANEHVLLIERGRPPGKGLWAVPGGFLEPRERVLQGAIRELREETGLALLPSTMEGAFKAAVVFDHPDRSLRGRTVTHAHWFDLGKCRLPEVRGADDAAQAKWVPFSALAGRESSFFEDHFNMLDHFLSLNSNN